MPPLSFRRVSRSNFILGGLFFQIKDVQACRKDLKKEVGICMGMVCRRYIPKGGVWSF